jgi:MFS superfamily sulfate permease-like transporter
MEMATPLPKHSTGFRLFLSLSGVRVRDLAPDLFAGLMLAAIAVPEQMATAKLGGFPPEAGFIAFIAAAFAFAIFGASRYISVGADSTITPIFAAGLALIAPSSPHAYVMLAGILALLVGIILIAAGILRLGWIANLLSVPVTTGFLAGIAVHIAVSQLPTALGIQPGTGDIPHQLTSLISLVNHTNPFALSLSVGVLATTLLAERASKRVPGALVGLVMAALVSFVFHLGDRGVEMLGPLSPIDVSLNVSMPQLQDLIRLVPLALIVSLVIMVQSAATARSSPSDEASDFNRDLAGIGAANIFSALAGAFPVNASPPRTAIAADTGARSQICGLAAAALVGFLALFGSGLLRAIPSAALAGVLLYVSWRITRVGTMLTIFRQSKAEFALIVITILAIVLLPIDIGVGFGILLSLLHGMWTVTGTRLIELKNVPGTTIWWPSGDSNGGTSRDGVQVVAFQAPLSFLNAEEFRANFADILARESTRLVVLEAGSIVEIDFTAAQVLKDVIEKCHEHRMDFAIARLESVRARQALERFGVIELLGNQSLFRSVDDAVKALARPHQAPP